MKLKRYDPEVLEHLHEVELMILKDFIEICEENNLNYSIYCGSLLGTIRHGGFIPWDDDLDVAMFRKDFERFKEIFLASNNEKYELLTNDVEPDYCYFFSKFMLKDTRFEEEWMEQFNFNIGLNIDIFVLEDCHDNKLKRYYITRRGFIYNRLLISSGIKLDDMAFIPKIISHFVHNFLNLLNLNPHKITQRCLKFLRNNSHEDSKYVFDISTTFEEFPLIHHREDFENPTQAKFEDIYVNVPKNYDRVLKTLFGDDYMTLPPEEKRFNHAVDFIDFGEY